MRTVDIIVHRKERLQIFVKKHIGYFELWVAGPIKGRQMLLDHHLTHDDLEACLEYVRSGDLLWRDAERTEIPTEKHENAVEMEKTIKQRMYLDYNSPQIDEMEAVARKAEGLPLLLGAHESVVDHLGSIAFLAAGKEEVNAAKQELLGRWTDGVVTIDFERNNKLRWSCSDLTHHLNVGEMVHGYAPNWWNFSMWRLALLNNEHKCGTHVVVLRVDKKELHLLAAGRPQRIAHVFKRVSLPEEIAVSDEAVLSKRRPKKTVRVHNEGAPSLRRLEQAIVSRNPSLIEQMEPGLSESSIRDALNKAGVTGSIEPIVQLYRWRNGTRLTGREAMAQTSFFPMDFYQLLNLEDAIKQWKAMNEAANQLRKMFKGTKARSMFLDISTSLFPIFSDGFTGAIAVDLTPRKQGRVFSVDFESEKPVHLAYRSFEAFLEDAALANENGRTLRCFKEQI